ncbi:MAG: hypothetical protein LKI16_07605 [Heyndrickxia oleronia]|nr:hypothetical protein [Heyndrickxia oleronia]MCI1760963.1 hypothetical protein [Heyndrickxia oleronia]
MITATIKEANAIISSSASFIVINSSTPFHWGLPLPPCRIAVQLLYHVINGIS